MQSWVPQLLWLLLGGDHRGVGDGGGVLSRAVLGGWGQVETEQLGSGDSMTGVERWEGWWAGGGGEGGGGVTAAAVISSTWPSVTPTVHCLYGW